MFERGRERKREMVDRNECLKGRETINKDECLKEEEKEGEK